MSQQKHNFSSFEAEVAAMDCSFSAPLRQWQDEMDNDNDNDSQQSQSQQGGGGGGMVSSGYDATPIHLQQQQSKEVSNFMDNYGFSFNGSIGDLPLMPNDMGSSLSSPKKYNSKNNNWGDKQIMSGIYNEVNTCSRLNHVNTDQPQQQQMSNISSSTSGGGKSKPTSQKHVRGSGNKRSSSGTIGISSKSKTNASKDLTALPPFLLFDAPCELRYNFAQTQQEHNLPLHVGANDLHYGFPVNGFHPQVNAQENPPVQMLDARHCRQPKVTNVVATVSERNEREQKRAHKITELIEELRVSMIDGGWNVQIKSKYHTLSTCQDYVRHLIKTTTEMEDKIRRVKQDAELKNIDIGTSEAESTSSFASDTTIARKRRIIRNLASHESMNKKLRSSHEGSVTAYSNEEENRVIDEEEAVPSSSSVVALTDSEATLTSAPGIINEVPLMVRPESENEKSLNSSKAWIALDDICYDDVFLESNVPQIISSTSGRIVSWNKALLKLLGITKKQIRHITLFSLVKMESLSVLFTLVAKTLRDDPNSKTFRIGVGADAIDFESITLPCISFNSHLLNCRSRQLYMTVTLIADLDPLAQCIQCVFTDCRGISKHNMGFLSDELLISMHKNS